jgi:glycine/D-amino acid oxidase-like deaminating enzyme
VICSGFDGCPIPEFNKMIPLSPVKGEIMVAALDHGLKDTMISAGIYVVPIDDGHALVGATYEWDNTDDLPTKRGLDQLKTKLGKIFRASFTVEEHYAAIRPASPDRRPIAGFLDENNRLGIINGFGSKGVMFAPYIADKMKSALENGAYPDVETDIRRFSRIPDS